MTFVKFAKQRPYSIFLSVFITGFIYSLSCFTSASATIDTPPDTYHTDEKYLKYSIPMEEIIVTSIAYVTALEMPKSVSVITANDIESSGANNLAEFLSREANITFTSYSGNTKFSRLDIRGSGETSVSNVVTLIDGVRVNTPDLAGTDFSIISLNQIERIEIVRGANSVRFGSGATLGVINIITKRAKSNSLKLTHFRKSYDTNTSSVSTSLNREHHSLLFAGKFEESNGYREHNDFLNKDLLLSYDYRFNEDNRVSIKSQYHFDEYQLPGPLFLSELANGIDRRSGDLRGLEGETKDKTNLLHIKLKPLDNLGINSLLQYRERENFYWFGDDGTDPNYVRQDNLIDLSTFTANLTLNWESLSTPLKISGGIDYEKADYFRTLNGVEREFQNIRNVGDFISRAAFIHTEYEFFKRLNVSSGYRINVTDNNFEVQSIGEDTASSSCEFVNVSSFLIPIPNTCPLVLIKAQVQNDEWKDEVFEVGAVFSMTDTSSLYGNIASSFRNPNIDELALPTSDRQRLGTLRPQNSDHYELGIKYSGEMLSASLGFFHIETNDEIIFLPEGGINAGTNHNFNEKITRRGFELETRFYPHDAFVMQWNVGYVDAQSASNNRIPLVPTFNTSLFYGWDVNHSISFYAETKHVDERFDGNDFENTGTNKLDNYSITNVHLTINDKSEKFSLLFSVNNLFNEQYFSTGFNGGVYPAPERNYSLGISFDL